MTTFVAQHPRTATATKAPVSSRFSQALSSASASFGRGFRRHQTTRTQRLLTTDPFVVMSLGRD